MSPPEPNEPGRTAAWTDPRVRGAAYVAVPWLALAAPGPLGLAGVGLLTLLAAALLWRDPAADRAVLLVVAAFTVCDVSPLSYAGSVVRLYQLSFLQVLVVLVRHRRALWRALVALPGLPRAVLLLVLALTVLTPVSLLWTISARETAVSTVGQVSATALLVVYCAAVAARLLTTRSVLTAVWAMATASSAAVVLEFLLTVATPLDLADSGGSGVPWPRPDGLMTEAIWAALVAATGAALAVVVRRQAPRLATASLALHVATLALVMSRAVLLGILVAGAVVLVIAGRRYVTVPRVVAAAALVVVGVALAGVLAPSVVQRLDPRSALGIQGNADGGSAASRTAVYRLVADELPHHLPLGAGAGSLNALTSDPEVRATYIDGGQLNTGRGSTNFFLGYTFDFGPLGAALAVALAGCVLALGLRLVPVDSGLTVFLTLLYLVDFEFNNGFRFGFVHLLLGVAAAAAATHRRPRDEADRADVMVVEQRTTRGAGSR